MKRWGVKARSEEGTGMHLPLGGGVLPRGGGSSGAPALGGSTLLSTAGSPVTTISIPACTSSGSSAGSSESTGRGTANLPLVGETSIDGAGTDLIGAGDLGLLNTGGVLVLLGFRVAVEVQIRHDVPLGVAASEGAAETEDLTGEHPPDETDGVAALVVCWDGHIDVLGGGVSVAKGLFHV